MSIGVSGGRSAADIDLPEIPDAETIANLERVSAAQGTANLAPPTIIDEVAAPAVEIKNDAQAPALVVVPYGATIGRQARAHAHKVGRTLADAQAEAQSGTKTRRCVVGAARAIALVIPAMMTETKAALAEVHRIAEALALRNAPRQEMNGLRALRERLQVAKDLQDLAPDLAALGIGVVDSTHASVDGAVVDARKLLGILADRSRALIVPSSDIDRELGLDKIESALRSEEDVLRGLSRAAAQTMAVADGKSDGVIRDAPYTWGLGYPHMTISAGSLDREPLETLLFAATIGHLDQVEKHIEAILGPAGVPSPTGFEVVHWTAPLFDPHVDSVLERARGVLRNEIPLSDLCGKNELFDRYPSMRGLMLSDVLQRAAQLPDVQGTDGVGANFVMLAGGIASGEGLITKVFDRVRLAHVSRNIQERPILPTILDNLDEVAGIKDRSKSPHTGTSSLAPKEAARVAFFNWYVEQDPEFGEAFDRFYGQAEARGLTIVDFEVSGLMGPGGWHALMVERHGVQRRVTCSADQRDWKKNLEDLATQFDRTWFPSAPADAEGVAHVRSRVEAAFTGKKNADIDALARLVAMVERDFGISLSEGTSLVEESVLPPVYGEERDNVRTPVLRFEKNGFSRDCEVTVNERHLHWLSTETLLGAIEHAWWPSAPGGEQKTTARELAELLGRGRDPIADAVRQNGQEPLELLARYCDETGAKVLGVFAHRDEFLIEVEAKGRVAQVNIEVPSGRYGSGLALKDVVDAVIARLEGRSVR